MDRTAAKRTSLGSAFETLAEDYAKIVVGELEGVKDLDAVTENALTKIDETNFVVDMICEDSVAVSNTLIPQLAVNAQELEMLFALLDEIEHKVIPTVWKSVHAMEKRVELEYTRHSRTKGPGVAKMVMRSFMRWSESEGAENTHWEPIDFIFEHQKLFGKAVQEARDRVQHQKQQQIEQPPVLRHVEHGLGDERGDATEVERMSVVDVVVPVTAAAVAAGNRTSERSAADNQQVPVEVEAGGVNGDESPEGRTFPVAAAVDDVSSSRRRGECDEEVVVVGGGHNTTQEVVVEKSFYDDDDDDVLEFLAPAD